MFHTIILFFTLCVWLYSFYYHFVRTKHSAVMISYIGRGNFRQFEKFYRGHGHDLWAFGHHPRRTYKCSFGEYGHAFQTFQTSQYKQMLLLKKAMYVPLIFDSEAIIHYKYQNESIATLWPKLSSFPKDNEDLEWIIKNKIPIETLYL